MPVAGNPFSKLKRAIGKVAKDRREVSVAMVGAVRELIEDQFGFGVDPYGLPQPPAKGKFSGLMSTKLARAIKLTADANGLMGLGELKSSGISRRRRAKGKVPPPMRPRRQWLNAHQKGHAFPTREVEGQRRFFDGKGQRISAPRFKSLVTAAEKERVVSSWWGLRKTRRTTRYAGASRRVVIGQRESYWQESKNRARLKGRIMNVRSHRIGERVLKVRRIYPEPQLGARWGGRIKSAVSEVLVGQFERAVDRG